MSNIQVPLITIEDLVAFQEKHFPSSTPPQPIYRSDQNTVPEEATNDEDDDLGYYPDGVKRTLTDEQVRIFRHSEIHSLLRERQLREENDSERSDSMEAKSPESGERAPETTNLGSCAVQVKKGTREKGQDNEDEPPKQKTQDTVKELVSNTTLDYSEESAAQQIAPTRHFMGRRIISYDD